MAKTQLVILSNQDSDEGMAEISSRRDFLRDLAACNTGPEREGDDILYGPGIRLELAPEQDPITQVLLTIDDEDIGWMTIMRLAKKFDWKLLDPTTGRELVPR